jgi:hypothetical protein
MHGTDDRDIIQTLGSMFQEALQRNNQNRVAAREEMTQAIKYDRRLDSYDPAVLARRTEECWYSGGKLNLDDPRLKGGEARPLTRDHWQYGR